MKNLKTKETIKSKNTLVLKFGGSSVSDNLKLNIVADKIKKYYKKNNVVVVVSAQGKTTDELIKQAKELSNVPNDRELDTLISTGEQVTIAKLAILLNMQNIPAISLTGWQAGIFTSKNNQSATIEHINTQRIEKELAQNKVTIIAGFQGLNEVGDITTLGRGGSDTTAVAVAAALGAKACYIFSDVAGVYSTDPNKVQDASKIGELTYKEMLDISDEGAKVLHNRCIEIGQRFNIPIYAKSTFNDEIGTIIASGEKSKLSPSSKFENKIEDNKEIKDKNQINVAVELKIEPKIEDTQIKQIVKNDNLILVTATQESYDNSTINKIYSTMLQNNIFINDIINLSNGKLKFKFTIKKADFNKVAKIISDEFQDLNYKYKEISKIAIIGCGLMQNTNTISKTLKILDEYKYNTLKVTTSETKIQIIFNEQVSDELLKTLHGGLVK